MDAVITYVDNTDPTWMASIKKYTEITEENNIRYRSWNNLKYCLRSIAKNMPFVRKVHLIVSGPSQVPKWVNTDEVNIVYHKDIIPEKYLPTFNSRTIELHMHNIKDLDEEFVYFNDDMFVISPSVDTNFFVDGKPCNFLQKYTDIEFKEKITKHPVYLIPYQRCTTEAARLLNMESLYYYFSNHGPSPMLKSVCKKVYDELGEDIQKSFSKFRSESDYDHFIYSIYQLLGGYTAEKRLTNKYIRHVNSLTRFYEEIRLNRETCLCMHDSNAKNPPIEIVMHLFNETMDMHFPNISKYEKGLKVGLCVVVKNENPYLKEFVEHYKNLGFYKIYLYDNNDINGEEPYNVIGEYIDDGFVVYHNYKGKKVCQLEAYNDCYKTYSNTCDWIAFFDADEFLELWRHKTIADFINQDIFKKYNCIRVNWMIYGDNGQVYYEDKPIKERFPFPVIRENNYFKQVNVNYYVKSIVKCGNEKCSWKSTAHSPIGVLSCNSLGATSLNTMHSKPVYNDIVLKHYITKSTEEYLEKVRRGYPDQIVQDAKRVGLLRKYFTINDRTEEKELLINNEIKKK